MPIGSRTGAGPDEVVPPRVLADVAAAVGTEVTVEGRFAGGLNAGAVRVGLLGRGPAVLKAVARNRPGVLEETRRARRIVDRMRDRGYPTPAWIALGAVRTHVWHLMELVDAEPVRSLAPSVVEQLMEVVELQAGQGSEAHDHWAYAWQVATGREPATVGLGRHSPAVAALVERLPTVRADAPRPRPAPDMVHADLNPSNVLVRDGVVVGVVDVENAGRGTRATDLVTLQWHTYEEPLDEVRGRLWTAVLDLVGWEGAAVLTTTQVLLQLAWPIRADRDGVVSVVVERGHRALDELGSRGRS